MSQQRSKIRSSPEDGRIRIQGEGEEEEEGDEVDGGGGGGAEENTFSISYFIVQLHSKLSKDYIGKFGRGGAGGGGGRERERARERERERASGREVLLMKVK